MATFREWLTGSLAPQFLRKEWGTKYIGLVADTFDVLSAAAKEAVKVSFPGVCPNDALSYNGAARNIERYTWEQIDDDYRARISDPWSVWDFAGSNTGLITKIRAQGYFVVQGVLGWYQLTPNVPDKYRNWPSAFWVWLRQAHIQTDGLWSDSGTWNDIVPNTMAGGVPGLGVWDCNKTINEITELRAAIRKWKSAHEICVYISFQVSSDRWTAPGIGGSWDNSSWDDGAVINIPG